MIEMNCVSEQLYFEFQPIVKVGQKGEYQSIYAKEALLRSNATKSFPANFFNASTESERETQQLFDKFYEMVVNFFENNQKIRLHVNIDPKQIKLSITEAKLQKWLPFAKSVTIELTEGQMTDGVRNIEQLALIETYLNKMQNLGFQIALDDIGTGENKMNLAQALKGYADLIKFTLLPYHTGQSYTCYEESLREWQRFSETNQLPLIIEGIETKAQAEFFAAQGIQLQQGFYWDDYIKTLNE
ncbi:MULTISPECIES: EAL domain-containing protein [unclassified Enterococcus]|uniref:EAL domain-containing protein n=1 Tax=unclassified Enterococcus TaxID=2608891 RepID=UPI0015521A3C|nr:MULTISPECIES: EAL domain-containing protein [unclassified Enterococcus]MBS7576612.1 EAL domain-containing protein [Enterococcus sp. MMGLQ5-2]MBS7583901.1 EAL domain-containing protein [Enterococcus sp. MMGLQ5-1]NPD11762.1 EAL domain-containing protein [Enterococcus sp. MMGLQ5-1]NPD36449.1 EAL domain-containing protein [Enterococcus sp. MMGLQ5-2]